MIKFNEVTVGSPKAIGKKGERVNNIQEREELFKNIFNKDSIEIEIKGVKIKMIRHSSLSGKTITYIGSTSLDLYKKYELLGIRKISEKTYIIIHSDCTVELNANGAYTVYLQPSEVNVIG